MERATAIKKLTKLLGGSLAYRVDPKAPRPSDRAAAQAQLSAAMAERKELAGKMVARREAVLAADGEYQGLKLMLERASVHVDRVSSVSRHYRFTVGTNNGLFFVVKAEGDTWEEVIAKIEKRG